MDRGMIYQYLHALEVKMPDVQNRTSFVISGCPLAPWTHKDGTSNPEVFGVRIEPGDSFCTCFACHYHGLQSELVMELKARNKTDPHGSPDYGKAMALVVQAEENAELEGVHSPDIEELLFGGKQKGELFEFPEWWLSTFPTWDQVDFAGPYLQARGIEDAVSDALQLHADSFQRRICFPVRNWSGVLYGLHGRQIEDIEPRYRMYTYAKHNNPVVWLGEHWVDLEAPVVVVEGPFDLAKVARVYGNVMSPLFANPSIEKIKRIAGASEVITFLDWGTAGDAGRLRFEHVLKDSIVRHVMPPKGEDPGSSSHEQIAEILGKFVPIDA